jgi:hypothetical protein
MLPVTTMPKPGSLLSAVPGNSYIPDNFATQEWAASLLKEISNCMWNKIWPLEKEELEALIQKTETVNEDNCSWLEYRSSQIVKNLAQERLVHLKLLM